MEKNMNLLLLIFTFITNWIVSASFWALYFLFTVPFFHEELAGNYELLTERILQLSLACVLVPAVLSGTGAMQYFFVRENGGRRAAGETKMYLKRLMRDICRRGRLELSDFRLYTAKADDYNAWAIGGNHITVTERLLNEFSEEEIKGILAHEVGHLQNGHSRFGLLRYGMEWFSGIIVYVYSVVTLLLAFFRWIPVLGIFIGIVNFFILIQYYFLKIFLQIPLWFFTQFGSRRNEYAADEYACGLGLGMELAVGLVHLEHIFHSGRRDWFSRLFDDHPDIPSRLERIRKILMERERGSLAG